MLYTKIQPQSFLGSGEEHFQEFVPEMDMAPSCSIARKHLKKLATSFRQKAHVKSSVIAQTVSEKKTFKITQLYTCM